MRHVSVHPSSAFPQILELVPASRHSRLKLWLVAQNVQRASESVTISDTPLACRAVSYPQIMPRQPKPSNSARVVPGSARPASVGSGSFGELALLSRIRLRAAHSKSPELQLGIGDDCALLRLAPGEELAVTTDLSIASTATFASIGTLPNRSAIAPWLAD